MSLSTALMPQQRPPCNRRSAQIFARIFEQRYGNWNFMKSRSLCRSSAVIEQQVQGLARCAEQLGSSSLQTRTAGLLALQRQQLLGLHREDYRIYPHSVDLDAFFGEEQKCDKVSDVCLLNDHFILVKMPHPEPTEEPKLPLPLCQPPRKLAVRLPRCFKCNRGNRVSPIREEPEPLSPWGQSETADDVEIFSSTTRIIPPHSQQQLDTSSLPSTHPGRTSVIVDQPLPQASCLQLDVLQTPPPPSTAEALSPPISRGPLHWFLWPFRRRLTRRPKAQLAAVHKTYFISWQKPPDTLWHGYGVERAVVDKAVLRRSRSAMF